MAIERPVPLVADNHFLERQAARDNAPTVTGRMKEVGLARRQCICGAPLHGLDAQGPQMFGFIPSSSLAHYNYDCEFDTGVTLPGGRVFEQCLECGAMTLCEYPTLDGSLRGDDPLITYGPGTVYEQCDIASVPVTYRSFRALMSSGVTGGVMYSQAFRANLAELFRTDERHMPSWKVAKDAMLDVANNALDEWWYASVGRNFIVLYEDPKVPQIVSAWHRIPGMAIKNSDIVRINGLNADPRRHGASDTIEMAAERELEIPDERRAALRIGNQARLRLIESGIGIGRGMRELASWSSPEALAGGARLFDEDAVVELTDTSFGIRHAVVRDDGHDEQVDLLTRHDVVAKVACTCDVAQSRHVCAHIVAMVLEIARRYRFRITLPTPVEHTHGAMTRTGGAAQIDRAMFDHYADVLDVIHEDDADGPRYDWLTSYIEPFEAPSTPLYRVEFLTEGPLAVYNVGYCVYNEVVLSFIDIVISQGDHDYMRTLRRYGLDKDVSIPILNVDTLDAELIAALVTMIVYRERRNEGYLAECLESGVLVRLLRRLRDIDGVCGRLV